MLKYLFLFLPSWLVGQDFMNIECRTNGKVLLINQEYIHIENKPVIRVHCICTNVLEPVSLLSYEWRSKYYKYSFETMDNLKVILVAIDPEDGDMVRVWEIDSIKMKIIQDKIVNK